MTFSSASTLQKALCDAGLARREVRVQRKQSLQLLRFGATDVQSSMDRLKPDHLMLNYTRLMMGFIVFQPRPKHMLMIGLGGGSLPKFCHRQFPGTDITVVEIDPRVIALRDQFEVPPDQQDFRVVKGDGADFVAAKDGASFDVIMVDGFDADCMSSSLGTASFYGHCARLLVKGGVLVCNVHVFDLESANYVERIAQAFDSEVLDVEASECFNNVVFARKSLAITDRVPTQMQRPPGMHEQAWAGIKFDVGEVLSKASRISTISTGWRV